MTYPGGRPLFLFFLAFLLGRLLAPASAVAESVDRVVARINGEIVTERDLQREIKERGQSSISTSFVTSFFDQTLLEQEAGRKGIGVPEEMLQPQVEEMVREIRIKYPSESVFRKELASEGMSLEQLKEKLLKRAKTDHQIFQLVTAGANITEQDIVEYEQSAQSQGRSPTSLHLLRLAVPVGSGGSEAACDKVAQLAQKISADGIGFGEGIRRYSAVPDGDLGWMDLSQLSPEVIEATKELKPGQASVPIVTGGFASIFYLEGKRGGRSHLMESRFTERKAELVHRLRSQAQVEIYSDKLQRVLPKEYAQRAKMVPGGAASGQVVPVSDSAAPTPEKPARKGLLGMFSRGK